MSELLILLAVAFGQIVAFAVGMAAIALCERLLLAWRLRTDRGLAYTWRRAWQAAERHV